MAEEMGRGIGIRYEAFLLTVGMTIKELREELSKFKDSAKVDELLKYSPTQCTVKVEVARGNDAWLQS